MGRRRDYATGWPDARGVWHRLRQPHRKASAEQLLLLNKLGLIDLAPPGQRVARITAGEASYAITEAEQRETAARAELNATDPESWGEA